MTDKIHNVDKWVTIEDIFSTAVTGAVGIFGKPQPAPVVNNYYTADSPNSANVGLPNTTENRDADADDKKKKSPLLWIGGGLALVAIVWFLLKK